MQNYFTVMMKKWQKKNSILNLKNKMILFHCYQNFIAIINLLLFFTFALPMPDSYCIIQYWNFQILDTVPTIYVSHRITLPVTELICVQNKIPKHYAHSIIIRSRTPVDKTYKYKSKYFLNNTFYDINCTHHIKQRIPCIGYQISTIPTSIPYH